MTNGLFGTYSLTWIFLKQSADEVFGLIGDKLEHPVLTEINFLMKHLLSILLWIFIFKRKFKA